MSCALFSFHTWLMLNGRWYLIFLYNFGVLTGGADRKDVLLIMCSFCGSEI